MTRICINAYGIRNASHLAWPVRRYTIRPPHGVELSHADRGAVKNAVFALRKLYAARCRGYGFVVDLDSRTVAVPGSWQIPSGAQFGDLIVDLDAEFIARADDRAHDPIVGGILREGLKQHVKGTNFEQLGPLWQNYDRFCQIPHFGTGERYVFCRSFFTQAKRMAGAQWALVIGVTTAVVDGYSLGQYLARGEADDLTEAIQWKRSSRNRRDSAPSAVRAFVHGDGYAKGRIVELDEPEVLAGYGTLSLEEQRQLAGTMVACREFKQPYAPRIALLLRR